MTTQSGPHQTTESVWCGNRKRGSPEVFGATREPGVDREGSHEGLFYVVRCHLGKMAEEFLGVIYTSVAEFRVTAVLEDDLTVVGSKPDNHSSSQEVTAVLLSQRMVDAERETMSLPERHALRETLSEQMRAQGV